jgi:hypothetical protein
LDVFANPFFRAHLTAVFHRVQSEVDLGHRLLLPDCAMELVCAPIIHRGKKRLLEKRCTFDDDAVAETDESR